jgi:hypothetical protein
MLSIVLGLIAIASTTAYIFSFIKIKKMSNDLLMIKDLSSDGIDIHTKNFIKFLSDSREMAFDYIDNAQDQIKNFVDIADKEFAFFDAYGSLTSEYPHYDAMKTISEEYKKLKSLLPEEQS